MMVHVPGVLTRDQVRHCRQVIDRADWVDGNVTAGHQSSRVKRNMQLPESSAAARQMGELIIGALAASPLFISAALPARTFPPLFNRYQGGEAFGNHVDNAIRPIPGTAFRIRTDLSATLFLADPDDYDGGELLVEDLFGTQEVKLPAGDMVLYPASSLHRVNPVTRGARVASFFWIQSMVRDDARRTLLFDLDNAIGQLGRENPDHPTAVQLTAVYHNLLRMWAEV